MTKYHQVLRGSLCSALLLLTGHVSATAEDGEFWVTPADVYKSPNFVLHTDLPAEQALQTLSRMEAALRFASRYWRRRQRGQIDCYLVADLKNWPDSALPHPLARIWVGGIGGATIGRPVGDGRRMQNKATVYSAARSGIIEHEVIHAYCAQTFGEMGPDWYKEGMADVARFHSAGDSGVACAPERIQLLRGGEPRNVRQVIAGDRFTYGISDSLGAMLRNRRDEERHVPLSDWSASDDDQLRVAQDSYAWSWALCHLLVYNPNYSERFRALGSSYLSKRQDSFARAFDSMSRELDFELEFFVQHVEVGYRVELCSWDWHKRFRTLDQSPEVNCRVDAARGFQATGLSIVAGRRYRFLTSGSWTISAEGKSVDAAGQPGGHGALTGVVMNEFRLSRPFDLGAQGEFLAPATGQLYLRCRDAWNKLADNRGEIQVQFSN